MVSIVIPAYEMQGEGGYFLERAISSCKILGYDNIIVADQTYYKIFEYACDETNVKHISTKANGAAANLNTAIDAANGDIIKVLFQDDQLGSPIDTNFTHWSFCTSKHNTNRGDHVPYHPPSLKELAIGCNTYGSPSAMAFRKTDLRFDENLQWLFDVDFYVRMTQRYGLPDLLPTFVNITEWEGMATNTVCTGDIRVRESEYMSNKYKNLTQ